MYFVYVSLFLPFGSKLSNALRSLILLREFTPKKKKNLLRVKLKSPTDYTFLANYGNLFFLIYHFAYLLKNE